MNTQAFSLILFNSFRLAGGGAEGKSFINLKQQLGNILTSQLNNLANRYINFAEVNFGIETLNSQSGYSSYSNFYNSPTLDRDNLFGTVEVFPDETVIIEIKL